MSRHTPIASAPSTASTSTKCLWIQNNSFHIKKHAKKPIQPRQTQNKPNRTQTNPTRHKPTQPSGEGEGVPAIYRIVHDNGSELRNENQLEKSGRDNRWDTKNQPGKTKLNRRRPPRLPDKVPRELHQQAHPHHQSSINSIHIHKVPLDPRHFLPHPLRFIRGPRQAFGGGRTFRHRPPRRRTGLAPLVMPFLALFFEPFLTSVVAPFFTPFLTPPRGKVI